MHRLVAVVLCGFAVFVSSAHAQNSAIAPIHVAAGTVLTFHLQSRLQPAGENALDVLPKGTAIQVKMLNSIDSSVNLDGAKFHGSMVTSLNSGDAVVVNSESEVIGILALLRSRSHPEGFRYELLVTGVRDHGKFYALTASLNSSFADVPAQVAASPAPKLEPGSKSSETAARKVQ